MGNSQFRFKEFIIEQDRCAMKVGTDGVLLGSWAEIKESRTILDVGTGTGLIALMCAQRNKTAMIQAIEISAASAHQAAENISRSKFAASIQVDHISIQDFQPKNSFDAIICNPPFFKAGTKSPTPERHLARHAESLTMNDLLHRSRAMINEHGKLHMILPLDRKEDLNNVCQETGWFIEKLTTVYPNFKKPPKRILVTCSSYEVETDRSDLMIEKGTRFDYTDEYIQLTAPFYSKMSSDKV